MEFRTSSIFGSAPLIHGRFGLPAVLALKKASDRIVRFVAFWVTANMVRNRCVGSVPAFQLFKCPF
ncbi:hypothetical protein [Phaeobacter inhibens]|uniref:hypothetical protein n=1 Tax=Phaeobacter inhibens TaxID=221822 RepID=UPI0021A910E3|nr:hypothetical protein [Phaeobacter inhibens]UWR87128.1 hypothetical protein K4L01_10080 [Phaeobacter inhibens]